MLQWLLKHGALPPHLVAGCFAGSKAGGIIPDTQSPDPKNLNLYSLSLKRPNTFFFSKRGQKLCPDRLIKREESFTTSETNW
jgi:hypothetical protein